MAELDEADIRALTMMMKAKKELGDNNAANAQPSPKKSLMKYDEKKGQFVQQVYEPGSSVTDAMKHVRGSSPVIMSPVTISSTYFVPNDIPNPMFPSLSGFNVPIPEGLPPGVDSLEMWGRTVMTQGKFNNTAYKHIYDTNSGYCRWVLGNCDNTNTSAVMRDFRAYIITQDKANSSGSALGSQTPLIPGSHERRKFV